MNRNQQKIQSFLTGGFGKEMLYYEQIDSTNNAARLQAKNGAPHGFAVVALQQTAGKGRQGRSFISPAGAGVYLSVILRPALPAATATLLTPVAAVATARAIAKICGLQVKIKWVNDLYYNGKKLCGILTESALRSDGMLAWAVIGIGVNLLETELPDELKAKITTLEAAGVSVDAERFTAEILNELESLCDQLETKAFMEEYRARSCVLGKQITVIQGDRQTTAQALEITDGAALVVITEQGELWTLNSGEISLRGDFDG